MGFKVLGSTVVNLRSPRLGLEGSDIGRSRRLGNWGGGNLRVEGLGFEILVLECPVEDVSSW